MDIQQLKIIIKNEFVTDVRGKSFWISTFLVPIIVIIISGIFGYLMAQSDTFTSTMEKLPTQPDPEEMTVAKAAGMAVGFFLFIFLISYGAMIFNKVKTEKCNRIMEILSTCVDGRTMMLGKIISVGLVGLLQMACWGFLIFLGLFFFLIMFPYSVPYDYLGNAKTYLSLLWMILYFIGGYVMYGSLYAACGAITDKDNENQIYMTIITFILLGAFYVGQYAIDNGASGLGLFCTLLPFTSPTVGTINAIAGTAPFWLTLASLAILYLVALLCVTLAGKLYRSSMLLKGKNFSLKDLITFIRS